MEPLHDTPSAPPLYCFCFSFDLSGLRLPVNSIYLNRIGTKELVISIMKVCQLVCVVGFFIFWNEFCRELEKKTNHKKPCGHEIIMKSHEVYFWP